MLAALGLTGCGSVAELPPPVGSVPGAARAGAFSVAGDRLVRADGASAATGRDPTAVALVDRGRAVAVLSGRERMLELYDARSLRRLGRASAGIGPVGLTTDGVELLYVTDSKGDAMLVYHLRPRFELIRRVHVSGRPYAIAYSSADWALRITRADGSVVEYAAGSRPVPRTPPR